jgi:hypothetical protein
MAWAGPQVAIGTARDEGKAAVEDMTAAALKKADEDREAAKFLEGTVRNLNEAEIKLNLEATGKINQRIADYTTALADFAAQKVNPTQLWDNMSGGMRFGTVVTAFVHDFLGAKGIKTSAMDTFKTAVDRNINAQIENIKNKGQVAQGFKTLYEMESQRSNSEAETRARIRGYMLEAAKHHVQANFSQYQSMLATAQGKKAMAELDKEFAKNYMDVTKHIQDDVTTRRNAAQQWEQHKANLAMEGWKTSVALKGHELAERKYRDELTAKAKIERDKFLGDVLIDPETNTGKWVIKEGRSDKEKEKLRSALVDKAETNSIITKMRELVRKNAGGDLRDDFAVGSRFSKQDIQLFDAMRQRLAHSLVKANGEKATDKDIEQYLRSFPAPSEMRVGDVERIIASTQADTIKGVQYLLQQNTKDIPAKMQKEFKGASGAAFEASAKEAEATEKMLASGGIKKSNVDAALEGMSSPAAGKEAKKDHIEKAGLDPVDSELAWGAAHKADPRIGAQRGPTRAELLEKDPNYTGKSLYISKNKDPRTGSNYTEDIRESDPGKVPTWAVSVQALSQAAQSGNKLAEQRLINWATKDIRVESAKDPNLKYLSGDDLSRLHLYAQYELSKMKGGRAKIQEAENAPAYPGADAGYLSKPQWGK